MISDKLKDLSQFADIQITEYEDNRVEYSFIPKRPERIETYNNGEQLSEYEMVKLTAVPSNQNAEIDLKLLIVFRKAMMYKKLLQRSIRMSD